MQPKKPAILPDTRNDRRHHDDEFYDEVHIRIVERYKTSGLSGDEWRFNYVVEFNRKGHIVHTLTSSHLQDALLMAVCQTRGHYALDESDADFKRATAARKAAEALCAQPGCRDPPVSVYAFKDTFAKTGDGPLPSSGDAYTTRFCRRHLDRGDSSREDCNDNYVVLAGPGPEQADNSRRPDSPAAFGGIIEAKELLG